MAIGHGAVFAFLEKTVPCPIPFESAGGQIPYDPFPEVMAFASGGRGVGQGRSGAAVPERIYFMAALGIF